MAAHGESQGFAHRASGGPRHKERRDAEAGVVIEAGDDLELSPASQPHPAHDIHLPELHGAGAFPSSIVLPLASSLLRVHQAVADQQAIDGGAAGKGEDVFLLQVVTQGPGSPAGMRFPEFEDAGLGFGGHLVRAGPRSAGVIGQTANARRGITPQPAMDRLSGHPVSHGHIADRGPGQHFEHGFVPLFHQSQLHKYGVCPPQIAGFLLLFGVELEGEVLGKCHTGTGATVAQVPEPRPEVEHTYRSHSVKYLPGAHIQSKQSRSGQRSEVERLGTRQHRKAPQKRGFPSEP